MKKILGLVALMAFAGLYSPANAEPVFGFIYKNTTEAFGAASKKEAKKVGCATCTSYFGLVGLGECGINDAVKNGGIKALGFYDVHTKNILGYKKVTVKAYGE